MKNMETLSIVLFIFAVIATILAFIFIVPAKRRHRLNGFGKALHDIFNFKFLVIEKVLQALYILSTSYVVFLGFSLLFQTVDTYSYYGRYSKWLGGYGLLIMILGPIVVRLIFETSMMFILLIKNVIQINNKLKKQNSDNTNDIFATPIAPAAPAQQPYAQAYSNNICTNCGNTLEAGSTFCPYCGAKH